MGHGVSASPSAHQASCSAPGARARPDGRRARAAAAWPGPSLPGGGGRRGGGADGRARAARRAAARRGSARGTDRPPRKRWSGGACWRCPGGLVPPRAERSRGWRARRLRRRRRRASCAANSFSGQFPSPFPYPRSSLPVGFGRALSSDSGALAGSPSPRTGLRGGGGSCRESPATFFFRPECVPCRGQH